MNATTDILVIGGGIAGISIAATLANHAQVTVIEAESAPGYHASGRSVAFWMESYGGPAVQPLTTASGPLLAHPDPAFSAEALMTPRGAVHIGRAEDSAIADGLAAQLRAMGVGADQLAADAMADVIPGLRPQWIMGLTEPSCTDIDTAALLAAYRRQLIQRGGSLLCDCRLHGARRESGGWLAQTSLGEISCGIIVNAAGAWADEVARACAVAPVGIQPLRRSVVQLRVAPAADAHLPLVIDLAQRFYFKPVAGGRVWLTPHDEEPDLPGDVAPDELAVATAIERFEQAVDWRIEAVERRWAGLRSFAPDRAPVFGYDMLAPGFFWYAGQGGFGMQTAPAAALLAGALLTGDTLPAPVAHIDPELYAPDRFDL